MSRLALWKSSRRRPMDPEEWEQTLDDLSRQLCSPREIAAQVDRQQRLLRNGESRVRMFPVWRRYRWRAQKVARIQESFPLLKRLPLKLSVFLSEFLYR